MNFSVDGSDVAVDVEAVIVAGYTGRDRAAVQHHIDELAAIGIPPPASFPAYWILPHYLAWQEPVVPVVGGDSSGEAEVCLVVDGDDVYVTLGSDHTDRAAEALDIGLSKAICPKPVASTAWSLGEVDGTWDELVLRSWVDEGGREAAYQDGACSSLVPPLDLLENVPFALPSRFVMFTGTVPVIGGLRPAAGLRAELHDPRRGRSIQLAYRTHVLTRTTSVGGEEQP